MRLHQFAGLKLLWILQVFVIAYRKHAYAGCGCLYGVAGWHE